jgi:hypothetical protein
MSKFTFLFFVLSLFFFTSARADSPLTSASFSKAYKDVPIIIMASETSGQLTPELIEYLIDLENPIDIKVALINQLGWDKEVQNAEIFFSALMERKGFTNLSQFLDNGEGDDLLCMAYLKAMDDYFEVKDALDMAEKALSLESQSFTYNIITALIRSMYRMEYDWCEVYRIPDAVRMDQTMNVDMKQAAITIIFKYTDTYKEYCDEERNPTLIVPETIDENLRTVDNPHWDVIYKQITEKWKDVENPLVATFTDYSQDGIVHVLFTDQAGRSYDFGSGNHNLGEIRLYGPQSGVSNPDYLGKQFKITWEWKLSRMWFMWENYEQAIAPLPSIVHIEIIK